MSDIVQLAALRQQRRPRTGRSGEVINAKNDNSGSEEDSEGEEVESPRSRDTRPRPQRHAGFDDIIKSSDSKTPLPFISCKVSELDIRALISTASKQSLINKDVCNKIRGATTEGRRQGHRFVMAFLDKQVAVTLEVQDDIPDVVLGVDFLTQFKCCLNFKDKCFLVDNGRDDDVILPFLPEGDIPLKFRVHRSVAASF